MMRVREQKHTKQAFYLFLANLFIYSFTAYHSCLQFMSISFYLFIYFLSLSTWQLFVSLWDWFQIKSESWQTQRNHIQYFRFVVQLCESKGTDTNVSVSPDSNTAFNSPESVSAQTAKPHKPRTDRTLLATTSTRESPALQASEQGSFQELRDQGGDAGMDVKRTRGGNKKWKWWEVDLSSGGFSTGTRVSVKVSHLSLRTHPGATVPVSIKERARRPSWQLDMNEWLFLILLLSSLLLCPLPSSLGLKQENE